MKSRGFTLLEMLVGLSFLSSLLLILYSLLNLFSSIQNNMVMLSQQEVFELQFQHELMLSHDFELREEQLCYVLFEDEARCIAIDQNRLVKSPGYEILLYDVEHFSIQLHDEEIILVYDFKNQPKVSTFSRLKK